MKKFTEQDAIRELKKLGFKIDNMPFTLADFTYGMNVELEHGSQLGGDTNVTNDDPTKTAKITWAHMKESGDYYKELKKMESKLEKKASIEKVAATRAMKILNSGNKMGLAMQHAFEKSRPVRDTASARISARAKRLAEGGQVPKKMTAKAFKNLGKVDTLGTAPAINASQRRMKWSGEQNKKNLNMLRKVQGRETPISYTDTFGSGAVTGTRGMQKGTAINKIELAGKGRHKPTSVWDRENRGYTAFHEMSGELPDSMIGGKLGSKHKLPPNLFDHDTHNSPLVKMNDRMQERSLSPFGRIELDGYNPYNSSTYNPYKGSLKADTVLNKMRKPNLPVESNWDFRSKDVPLYKQKPFSKQEQENALMNAARFNISEGNPAEIGNIETQMPGIWDKIRNMAKDRVNTSFDENVSKYWER